VTATENRIDAEPGKVFPQPVKADTSRSFVKKAIENLAR
jgi:hypothetical protein